MRENARINAVWTVFALSWSSGPARRRRHTCTAFISSTRSPRRSPRRRPPGCYRPPRSLPWSPTRCVMNVDAADQLADGERIKVGVIANGVSNPRPHSPGRQSRPFRLPGLQRLRPGRDDRWPGGLPRRGRHRLAGQSDLRPIRFRQPGAPAAPGVQHQDQGHRTRCQPGRPERGGQDRLGGQQHRRTELGRHHRVQPAHGGRGRSR
jgi:hypothetical protein